MLGDCDVMGLVGLLCANLFVLLEKSALHRLGTTQQQFVAMVDELFPRRTMEQMLENFTPGAGPSHTPAAVGAVPVDLGDRLVGTLSDRLSPTVTALREASSSVKMLARLRGTGRVSRATENDSPTAWPGVG